MIYKPPKRIVYQIPEFRVKAHQKLFSFLDQNKAKIYQLMHDVFIGLDDLFDYDHISPEYYLRCKRIIHNSWDQRYIATKNELEEKLTNLGKLVREEYTSGFSNGRILLCGLEDVFEAEFRNGERRGGILTKRDLDEINIRIGYLYALHIILLVWPELDQVKTEFLSLLYGPPAKFADNVVDLWEDLSLGLCNIPREEIDIVKELVKHENSFRIGRKSLEIPNWYVQRRLKEVGEMFQKADFLAKSIYSEKELNNPKMKAIRDFSIAWLKEAEMKLFKEKF
ncbi:MAG: hypothetical protein ISS82_02630 [Nanoarchaeota archaeon]|nr:hypothetical protein [Nanoarchaeota archaeon]